MRALILLASIAIAGPAATQDIQSLQRSNDLRMEQEMARQQAISQNNQLTALEGQLRTDHAVRQLQVQSQRPALPRPYVAPGGAIATPPANPYVSIPDDRLAASNARVRAASGR